MSSQPSEALARDFLEEAANIIDKRGQIYGNADALFSKVAALWNGYLGTELIEGKDVSMMLALLKIARQAGQPLHEDNYTYAAAYIALAFGCHLKNAPEIKADVL